MSNDMGAVPDSKNSVSFCGSNYDVDFM